MALPDSLAHRLALPLIAAPMTGVSSLELVAESCRHGVIGAFPTHVAESTAELDRWLAYLDELSPESGKAVAPVAPNLVVHRTNSRLEQDVACLIRHGVELVITSVGSPQPVLGPLHDAGCAVYADVATMHHVERALQAGVDGLVLLTAGAGGYTGWNNPLSFVRAVRDRFDGPIVLAGGVGDGTALLSAQVLGADLAYMGTKFIATRESAASPGYRQAVVDASIDDVETALMRTGLPANRLCSRSGEAGPTPTETTPSDGGFDYTNLVAPDEGRGAGHSVYGVNQIVTVAELIAQTEKEYEAAKRHLRLLCERSPAVVTPAPL